MCASCVPRIVMQRRHISHKNWVSKAGLLLRPMNEKSEPEVEKGCSHFSGHAGQPHAKMRRIPMIPTITAFERSPDGGRGLARDMRVRWALEEVGQPYDVRLVSFNALKEPAH